MATAEKDKFGMPCDFDATPGISPSRYCLSGQCHYVDPNSLERLCPHGMSCDREGRCLHPVKS